MNKFIKAQATIYEQVLSELRSGKKKTHWMWYIFPQTAGLGHSTTAEYYAISDLEEAQQYLDHPILGTRLIECSEIMLNLENSSALNVLGSTDSMKLKSCMTLFAQTYYSNPVFEKILIKYFQGEWDIKTLELLKLVNSHAPLLSPLEIKNLRESAKRASLMAKGQFK